MPAGKYNLTIEQGASVSFKITILQSDGITPLVLTGYTFKGEIRKSPTSDLTVAFTCTVISTTLGTVQITLTPTNSKLLTDQFYYYDIIGKTGTDVYRFLEGKITVDAGITNA